MAQPAKANHALCIALVLYGVAYVSVVVLAGSNPPSFLLDAVGHGPIRRVAGALLWMHVAVSCMLAWPLSVA